VFLRRASRGRHPAPWTRGFDATPRRSPWSTTAIPTAPPGSRWAPQLLGTGVERGQARRRLLDSRGRRLDDAAYATGATPSPPARPKRRQTTRVSIRVAGNEGPLALATPNPSPVAERGTQAPRPHPRRERPGLGRELLQTLPGVRQRRTRSPRPPPSPLPATNPPSGRPKAASIRAGCGSSRTTKPSAAPSPGSPAVPARKALARVPSYPSDRRARHGDVLSVGPVQAPTPDDDSFFRLHRERYGGTLNRADWHLGTHAEWNGPRSVSTATPVQSPAPAQGRIPAPDQLPRRRGQARRLLLTTDPEYRP
jgi:hypothetical protein